MANVESTKTPSSPKLPILPPEIVQQILSDHIDMIYHDWRVNVIHVAAQTIIFRPQPPVLDLLLSQLTFPSQIIRLSWVSRAWSLQVRHFIKVKYDQTRLEESNIQTDDHACDCSCETPGKLGDEWCIWGHLYGVETVVEELRHPLHAFARIDQSWVQGGSCPCGSSTRQIHKSSQTNRSDRVDGKHRIDKHCHANEDCQSNADSDTIRPDLSTHLEDELKHMLEHQQAIRERLRTQQRESVVI